MRKQWPAVWLAVSVLTACTGDNEQQKTVSIPQPVVCHGPIVEITGAEPHYEVPDNTANQDYQRNGDSYKIVQNPANFSQSGLAAIYDAEPESNLTASGELFDPTQLTAAHPTLPVPSYARITNLANGRMIVVRINDRGPYGNDRVISLSRASADRLNTSNNTKVRIDPIIVAPDGSLSGPGMACTTVAKQTYALPARPDLNGNTEAMPAEQLESDDIRPISNATLTPHDPMGAPVNSSGFLGAPTPLNSGVLESEEESQPALPVASQQQPAVAKATPTLPRTTPAKPTAITPPPTKVATVKTAPAKVAPGKASPTKVTPAKASPTKTAAAKTTPAPAPHAKDEFVVQVGAISDRARAQKYQKQLSQQLSVPGRIVQNGAVWRMQLGPFASREKASTLQQRLQNELQLSSFITRAN